MLDSSVCLTVTIVRTISRFSGGSSNLSGSLAGKDCCLHNAAPDAEAGSETGAEGEHGSARFLLRWKLFFREISGRPVGVPLHFVAYSLLRTLTLTWIWTWI